jgi:RNA polymerase sigma factor (sigma-70 family)
MRRSKVSRAEAEDLVVDAMLRVIRLRPIARNPEALLATAAVNLFYDTRRRDAGPQGRVAIAQSLGNGAESIVAEGPIDHSTDPALELGEKEDLALHSAGLNEAVARLPPMDRLLLNSYYFEGRSLSAIDQERGELPGTAKVRLHRARRRLRKLVGADGDAVGRSR